LQVEYANCIGESKWKFIESPNKLDSTIVDYQTIPQENSGRENAFFKVPRSDSVYLYIEPDYLESVHKGDIVMDRSDYMIKARLNYDGFNQTKRYVLEDRGVI